MPWERFMGISVILVIRTEFESIMKIKYFFSGFGIPTEIQRGTPCK